MGWKKKGTGAFGSDIPNETKETPLGGVGGREAKYRKRTGDRGRKNPSGTGRAEKPLRGREEILEGKERSETKNPGLNGATMQKKRVH